MTFYEIFIFIIVRASIIVPSWIFILFELQVMSHL
jgi:hypothetical protein